uniref:Uncharacterized protein n=1 Tax=viral metagenome TaxID=1070528 RepID=A0A6C0IET9_9ZZZZ
MSNYGYGGPAPPNPYKIPGPNISYLYHAAEEGDLEKVKSLIEDENIKKYINLGNPENLDYTPLMISSLHGHTDVVGILLKNGADANQINTRLSGETPIHMAASNGHIPVIEHLLNIGNGDINTEDKQGRTPIYYAALYGQIHVVDFLLGRGIDINQVYKDGDNLLHQVAWNGHFEFARFLLDRGIEVNARNNKGETPLIKALHIGNNNINLIQLLLERGANVNLADNDGKTPLYYACANNNTNLVLICLIAGAKIKTADRAIAREKKSVHIIKILERWPTLSVIPMLDELNVGGIIDADFLTELYHMIGKKRGGGNRRKTRKTSNKKRRKSLKKRK